MKTATPVTRALDAQNIPHRLFHHPGPVRSLEQAARERGQQTEQVIRSILFRLAAQPHSQTMIDKNKIFRYNRK